MPSGFYVGQKDGAESDSPRPRSFCPILVDRGNTFNYPPMAARAMISQCCATGSIPLARAIRRQRPPRCWARAGAPRVLAAPILSLKTHPAARGILPCTGWPSSTTRPSNKSTTSASRRATAPGGRWVACRPDADDRMPTGGGSEPHPRRSCSPPEPWVSHPR